MDHPNSDQFELWPAMKVSELAQPWGGKSPRVLTAGYARFSLKAQAEKSVSDFVDVDQGDFWLPMKKAPWYYQGAPLLLPLQGG